MTIYHRFRLTLLDAPTEPEPELPPMEWPPRVFCQDPSRAWSMASTDELLAAAFEDWLAREQAAAAHRGQPEARP